MSVNFSGLIFNMNISYHEWKTKYIAILKIVHDKLFN